MALSHAEHPDHTAPTLREERMACGIDDAQLDGVVAGARMVGNECHFAGAAQMVVRIAADMRIMAAPVLESKSGGLKVRLDGLLHALPVAASDLLDPAAISAITRISRAHTDSLHQLVIDLHKQLNAMQADLAQKTLDGAAAYTLSDADRPLVLAFMKGVNRTARLKFLHPGLSTRAWPWRPGSRPALAGAPPMRRWLRGNWGRCVLSRARRLRSIWTADNAALGGSCSAKGDFLSLDENTGAVYPGRLAALTAHPTLALSKIATWTPAAAA